MKRVAITVLTAIAIAAGVLPAAASPPMVCNNDPSGDGQSRYYDITAACGQGDPDRIIIHLHLGGTQWPTGPVFTSRNLVITLDFRDLDSGHNYSLHYGDLRDGWGPRFYWNMAGTTGRLSPCPDCDYRILERWWGYEVVLDGMSPPGRAFGVTARTVACARGANCTGYSEDWVAEFPINTN